MFVFADMTDAVMGGGVATLTTIILGFALNLLKTKFEHKKVDEKTTIGEWRKIAARLETRVEKLENEVEECHEEHRIAEVDKAVLMGRLERYEEALTNAGIKFQPFVQSALATMPIKRPSRQPPPAAPPSAD